MLAHKAPGAARGLPSPPAGHGPAAPPAAGWSPSAKSGAEPLLAHLCPKPAIVPSARASFRPQRCSRIKKTVLILPFLRHRYAYRAGEGRDEALPVAARRNRSSQTRPRHRSPARPSAPGPAAKLFFPRRRSHPRSDGRAPLPSAGRASAPRPEPRPPPQPPGTAAPPAPATPAEPTARGRGHRRPPFRAGSAAAAPPGGPRPAPTPAAGRGAPKMDGGGGRLPRPLPFPSAPGRGRFPRAAPLLLPRPGRAAAAARAGPGGARGGGRVGGDSQSPPSRAPALIGRARRLARRRCPAGGAGRRALTFHRAGLGLLPPGHVRAPRLVLLPARPPRGPAAPARPASPCLLPLETLPGCARRSSGSSGIDYRISHFFACCNAASSTPVHPLGHLEVLPPGTKKITGATVAISFSFFSLFFFLLFVGFFSSLRCANSTATSRAPPRPRRLFVLVKVCRRPAALSPARHFENGTKSRAGLPGPGGGRGENERLKIRAARRPRQCEALRGCDLAAVSLNPPRSLSAPPRAPPLAPGLGPRSPLTGPAARLPRVRGAGFGRDGLPAAGRARRRLPPHARTRRTEVSAPSHRCRGR